MNVNRSLTAIELARVGTALDSSNIGRLETLGVPSRGPVAAAHSDVTFIFGQLIDGLPEQIALLDEQWNILEVNPAWTKTAALYGYDALRPGTNYFDFLCERAGEGHASAQPVIDGILEIAQGARTSFGFLYYGSDRWEGHTFQLCVNRIEVLGRCFATVTRYDVTELVQLRRARESYSHSVIEGQAEERRRMAREVHDSTTQHLVGLGFDIGQLKRSTRSNRMRDIVADMELLLGEAQREIRSLSFLAHPPLLQEQGLAGALDALVTGYERRTGLKISFQMAGKLVVGWPIAEITIYRFVQEALSNVHRHARATEVTVGVHFRHSMIHTIVADNGTGISSFAQPGVGLSGMRSRVAELGGRLMIRPAFPGTALIASLPLQPRLGATGDLLLNRP